MATQLSVIREIISYLDNTKETNGTAALSNAVRKATGYSGLAEALEEFVARAIWKTSLAVGMSSAEAAKKFLKEDCGIDLTGNSPYQSGCSDKDTGDTGAISGSDAGGSLTKTAKSIIPEPTTEAGALLSYRYGYNIKLGAGVTAVTVDLPKPADETTRHLITGLYNWWITGAIQLVYDTYGLSFHAKGSRANKVRIVLYDSDQSWASASAGISGSTIIMRINLADCRNLTLNHQGDASGLALSRWSSSDRVHYALYTDRLIAHEMVHALMEANYNLRMFYSLPQFFKEGIAELVHGADDGRQGQMLSLLQGTSEISLGQALNMYNYGTGQSESYSAGYMFLRYLAKRGAEMHLTDSLVYNARQTALTASDAFAGTLTASDYAAEVETVDASASKQSVWIEGNTNNNNILGGSGNDTLLGEAGNDTLTGGRGADVFSYAEGGGDDVIADYAAAQGDKILIAGTLQEGYTVGSDVRLSIGTGSITVKNAKNRNITLTYADGSTETRKFSADLATIRLPHGMSLDARKKMLVVGNAFDGTLEDGSFGFSLDNTLGDFYTGIGYKNLHGANAKQAIRLIGNAEDNLLTAGTKGATLSGGEGNDTLAGGAGKDWFVLHDGEGDNVVRSFGFGAGKDTLQTDAEITAENAALYYVAAAEKAAPTDGMKKTSADAVLRLGSGSASLVGGAMQETWISAAGGDARPYWLGKAFTANTFTFTKNSKKDDDRNGTIYIGTDAQETVDGSKAKAKYDTLKINAASVQGAESSPIAVDLGKYYSIEIADGSASTADLSLQGAAGSLTIKGGKGADLIAGGSGTVLIAGGSGDDTMTSGNANGTTFQFGAKDGSDTVRDFKLGIDKIHAQGRIGGLTGIGKKLTFSVGSTSVELDTTAENIDLMDSETLARVATSFVDAKGNVLDPSWLLAGQLPVGMTMVPRSKELSIGKSYAKQTDGISDADSANPIGFSLTSGKGLLFAGAGYGNINAASAGGAAVLLGDDGDNRLTGSRLGGTLSGGAGYDQLASSGTGRSTTHLHGGTGSDTLIGAGGYDIFDITGNADGDIDIIKKFTFGSSGDMLQVDEIPVDVGTFYAAAKEKAAARSETGSLAKASQDVLLSFKTGSASLVGGAMKETWIGTAEDGSDAKAYWFGKAFSANTFTYQRTVNSKGTVTKDDRDTIYIGTDAQEAAEVTLANGKTSFAKGKHDTLKVVAASIKGGSADENTVRIDLGRYYSIDIVDGSGSTADLAIDASGSAVGTTLKGGKGSDTLIGSDAADTFYYAAGKDVIQGADKNADHIWVSGAVREIGSSDNGDLMLFFDAAHTRTLTIECMGVDDLRAAYADGAGPDMAQTKIESGAYLISKDAAGTACASGLDKAIKAYGDTHWKS